MAWDTPGSGRSSDPRESFRLRDYADCLAGVHGRARIPQGTRGRTVFRWPGARVLPVSPDDRVVTDPGGSLRRLGGSLPPGVADAGCSRCCSGRICCPIGSSSRWSVRCSRRRCRGRSWKRSPRASFCSMRSGSVRWRAPSRRPTCETAWLTLTCRPPALRQRGRPRPSGRSREHACLDPRLQILVLPRVGHVSPVEAPERSTSTFGPSCATSSDEGVRPLRSVTPAMSRRAHPVTWAPALCETGLGGGAPALGLRGPPPS